MNESVAGLVYESAGYGALTFRAIPLKNAVKSDDDAYAAGGSSRRWVSYWYDPLANCDADNSTVHEVCDAHRNVTAALNFLKREGGTAVATSMYLGCGHVINQKGQLVLTDPATDPRAAGCAVMVSLITPQGLFASCQLTTV